MDFKTSDLILIHNLLCQDAKEQDIMGFVGRAKDRRDLASRIKAEVDERDAAVLAATKEQP